MTILQSIILALVEGLTEFLPVSSTGHMILTEGILGMESTAYLKAFTVMIQFGAILSVVVYYFRRFLPFPIFGLKPDPTTSLGGWRLYGLMIIGCTPRLPSSVPSSTTLSMTSSAIPGSCSRCSSSGGS